VNDKAVQARVEGRQRMAARTMWKLEAGPLQLRCVKDGPDDFHLEAKSEKGWGKFGPQSVHPLALLRVAVQLSAVSKVLHEIG